MSSNMQTVEAQHPSMLQMKPLSSAVGAEIRGIDLSKSISDATFELILNHWYEHGVLCIPGQGLEEMDQVHFAERFGELVMTAVEYESGKGSHPAIMYVTNEKKNGKYVGALPDGEMYFHSDMCYLERPVKATMLYAINIPQEGGNTLFANMYAAYDTLSEDIKHRIAFLKAVNTYEQGIGDTVTMRTRSAGPTSPSARSYAQPVVCTHPVTGKKALYVNRLMTEYIVGMPREESNTLLESLFDHQEQQKFIYEHRWTRGDLVMWDNRCILHARGDFSPNELRRLRRIAVKGEMIT